MVTLSAVQFGLLIAGFSIGMLVLLIAVVIGVVLILNREDY